MPITNQDVIDTFDSFRDASIQSMALQARLLERGFDMSDIATTINALINQGILVINKTGGIRRTGSDIREK